MRAEPQTESTGVAGPPPGLALRANGAAHPGPRPLAAPRAFPSGATAPATASMVFVRRHVVARMTKRALDITCAFLGLVLTAPLVALLSAVIRLDSKGPAFLRQTRIGRDGRPFELVKLRTMHGDERAQAEQTAGKPAPPAKQVTRVGRILRPMGLDELPQLWNVLAGDMSVVGPRPERPHLVAEYQVTLPGYADRHRVRPGITGWAQIHGQRGGARPIAERLLFDLEYVRSWHPLKDIRILVLTVSAVWRDTRQELRH